jgi:hypothetical protein
MSDLHTLAVTKFSYLTSSESKVLSAFAEGTIAWCGASPGTEQAENDPVKATSWDDQRTIRSEFLTWLCTNASQHRRIGASGLSISAARIKGKIDLTRSQIPFPIRLLNCWIPAGLVLIYARCQAVDVSGSYTGYIDARSLVVDGDLLMNTGFVALGGIDLSDAEILGDLNFAGAMLLNAHGAALRAERINVKRRLLLTDGFNACGSIDLPEANIGGNLDLTKAHIFRPGGTALQAVGIKVSGNVLLCSGFRAAGEINFDGSLIGADFICDSGRFKNRGSIALTANGAEINGSMHLNERFAAFGEVNLVGAHIKGQLACERARFLNRGATALNANGAKIERDVLLRSGFRAYGEVEFTGAEISGDLDCREGRFLNGSGVALVAKGLKVGDSILLRDGFMARGSIKLRAAEIGGDLDCTGARILCATILSSNILPVPRNRKSQGKGASLKEADETVSGDAMLEDANRPTAISAVLAAVKGNAWFRRDFVTDGMVDLRRASVLGDVSFINAQFVGDVSNGVIARACSIGTSLYWQRVSRNEGTELDLRHASIGALWDDEKSWPAKGSLFLDQCRFGTIRDGPKSAESRLRWLGLQTNYSAQPYEQLAKVLRDSGLYGEAINVLIAGENARTQRGGLTRSQRWGSVILGFTVRHGYRPLRAVGFIVVLWIIGSILFCLGYSENLVTPTDARAYDTFIQDGDPPPYYEPFSSLIYSLEAALPFVNLEQTKYWHPNPSKGSRWYVSGLPPRNYYISTGALLEVYLWLHTLLGWFLATMLVVGVTNLARSSRGP